MDSIETGKTLRPQYSQDVEHFLKSRKPSPLVMKMQTRYSEPEVVMTSGREDKKARKEAPKRGGLMQALAQFFSL
ncbi:MAG TPA: hypothetical protein PLE85_00250 [Bacteroidales bacterium]|nr:hypothetical protein [Lentimicrobiaceae bacterium]HOH98943.1 hypothetical protein [Bacteroidales bacterium]